MFIELEGWYLLFEVGDCSLDEGEGGFAVGVWSGEVLFVAVGGGGGLKHI